MSWLRFRGSFRRRQQVSKPASWGFLQKVGDDVFTNSHRQAAARSARNQMDSESLNLTNHINWRNHCAMQIQKADSSALHYTAVHSLSRSDASKVRDILLAAIRASREVLHPRLKKMLLWC
jgi:hypothetical protein